MNKDLTDLVIVSDRSGSMGSSREDSEGAINHFIKDQQGEEGECNVTLVEFDNEYDVLYDGVSVEDVGEYQLVPRGMTALYDAVGTAITTVGERLAKTPEADRPSLVTVVISTDGLNNASKEYSHSQIVKMIKTQREEFSWQFIFLGVELNEQIGIGLGLNAVNVVNLQRSNSSFAYGMTSDKIKGSRNMMASGMSCQEAGANMAYTNDEKTSLGSVADGAVAVDVK